jgi:hypothetical protein
MSQRQPGDDPSSAPESGTVRTDTSGNQPANRGERPLVEDLTSEAAAKDDPSVAGEER